MQTKYRMHVVVTVNIGTHVKFYTYADVCFGLSSYYLIVVLMVLLDSAFQLFEGDSRLVAA